jgi:hypothetical protein
MFRYLEQLESLRLGHVKWLISLLGYNPLKTETKLTHVQKFSLYRTVNNFSIGYENQEVGVYREIIAVCSKSHPKHKYALCEHEVQILGTKHSGTDSNH